MSWSIEANLTKRFGERVLQQDGIEFTEVTYVDLCYNYMRGWSDMTPGDWDYPVVIHYDNGKIYEKSYRVLSEIIKTLEDIAEDATDEAYE